MPDDIKKFKILGKDVEESSLSQARFNAPLYNPSVKAQEIIKNTWNRWTDMRNNRDQNYKWFGKTRDGVYRNLITYINTMEKRWNSDGIPRVNLEDWQASVFKPETRNKVITILSAVAQQRPRMKFKGREKSDYMRELVVGDMYDWSEDVDNGDEQALYTMLDAIIHGTAIRYEGYEDCKKVIKELKAGEDGYDLYNLDYDEKVIIEKKVVTKEVQLQDFYFGSMLTRRMDEQPDCVWRKLMRLNDFKNEFAGWDNAKFVLPGGDLTDETYFAAFASDEIREKQSELVEVLRYYSKETDEFIILANGVWVNPLSKSKVCPLPFSHKELPFYSVLFEPMSSTFPYGKALPDKMIGIQDSINALLNMALDQSFVSIHPLLVTGDEDVLDDVDLTPNSINYVGADVQNILEIKRSPPAPAHFNMLQFLHQSLEETSVDATQSGQTGDAGTATEVRVAAQAAARAFSLFLNFVNFGYRRKAMLRTQNILQFLTSPSILKKVLGDDGEERFDEAFQAFKVSNVPLMNGKQGTRIIELVNKDELQVKRQKIADETKELEAQNIEKFYISPEFIREFDFDLEIIEGSTMKNEESTDKALEIEFQTQILTMYPDLVNREALFEELLKKFKKDPRLIKNQMPMNPMMQPGMAPGSPGMPPGTPMSQQVTQRATGGRQLAKPGLNQLQR